MLNDEKQSAPPNQVEMKTSRQTERMKRFCLLLEIMNTLIRSWRAKINVVLFCTLSKADEMIDRRIATQLEKSFSSIYQKSSLTFLFESSPVRSILHDLKREPESAQTAAEVPPMIR